MQMFDNRRLSDHFNPLLQFMYEQLYQAEVNADALRRNIEIANSTDLPIETELAIDSVQKMFRQSIMTLKSAIKDIKA